MALHVSEGLHVAKDKGFMHRDIKPANILFRQDEDGQLLFAIADWGLAKSPTLENSFRGTFTTSAPEVYLTGVGNYGFQVDVWSFGSFLLEMLSNTLLITEEEFDRLVGDHKISQDQGKHSGKYSGMRSRFADGREIELRVNMIPSTRISPFFRELLKDLLRFDPSQRPTIKEVLNEVEAYRQNSSYTYSRRQSQDLLYQSITAGSITQQ